MYQGLLDYFMPPEGTSIDPAHVNLQGGYSIPAPPIDGGYSIPAPPIGGHSIPISEYGNIPGGAPIPEFADDPQFIGQSIPFEDAQPFAPSGGRGFMQPNMYDMNQYMSSGGPEGMPEMPGGRGYMSEAPGARHQYKQMQSEPAQNRMTMTTSPRTKFDKDGFNSGLQLMNMGIGLLD